MLYFEIRNIFNTTFVASANNITDTLNSTTGAVNPGSVLAVTGTGSIYAGEPRAFAGGVRFAFR
jgi:iron complex outermembrane receptor protein